MRSRKASAKRPMTSAGQAAFDIAGRRRAGASRGRATVDSAAEIRGVEPRRLDAGEAGRRDLDAGVVGGVGPGVLEDREAGGDDDRDALGLQGHELLVVGLAVALGAGPDVAVA